MCPKGEEEASGKRKRKEEGWGLGSVPIAQPPAGPYPGRQFQGEINGDLAAKSEHLFYLLL